MSNRLHFAIAVGVPLLFACRAEGPVSPPVVVSFGSESAAPVEVGAPSPIIAVPRAFTHNGKPIHPLCVSELVGPEAGLSETADLSACGVSEEPPEKEGEFFEHTWDEMVGRQPFFRYRVVRAGDLAVVEYIWNGGGTGYFSGVIAVAHTDGQLQLKQTFAGGDRCNGGVSDATVVDDAIEYAQNQTPSDLFALSPEGVALGIEAYHHLEASASSCVAVARYRHRIGAAEPELLEVSLDDEPLRDQAGWTTNYPYQPCFNRHYNKHLGKTLFKGDLEKFVLGFRDTCIGAPAAP